MSKRAREKRRKRAHQGQQNRRMEKRDQDERERIERRKRGGMREARKEARERELVRIGIAVEAIRSMRSEGWGYREIARELGRQGVVRPRGDIIWWADHHVGHLVRRFGL